ncbi:MAG: transposase [Planctomycetes bacterium]|nr:transposase [Planctomycetota bacterium]
MPSIPKTNKPKNRRPTAATLPFPNQHGGRRAGAGRKPNGDRAGVKHRPRQAQASRFPVHVTVKLRAGLPRLRERATYAALREAFVAARQRGGLRLVHYAVLNDHLHFVVEAQGRQALTRGVQGLLIRIARRLNKHWQRRGKVFADRFHDHVLKSPREVRNALRYVLGNGRKHAAEGREVQVSQAIDTFTSAPWFDGWKERLVVNGLTGVERPVAGARTWLLTLGWRRLGLLSVHEVPASA